MATKSVYFIELPADSNTLYQTTGDLGKPRAILVEDVTNDGLWSTVHETTEESKLSFNTAVSNPRHGSFLNIASLSKIENEPSFVHPGVFEPTQEKVHTNPFSKDISDLNSLTFQPSRNDGINNSDPVSPINGLFGHTKSSHEDQAAATKQTVPELGHLRQESQLTAVDVAIVVAGFIVQMFPQGLGNSYGVVYDHLMATGEITDVQVSWIGSIMTGMMGFGAIGASYLGEEMGLRVTCVLGAILTSLGFLISAFTTNVYVLYLTLGAMPGLGCAFSQLAAVICVSRKFNKGRPLAMGIVSTGGAVGMLTFPLLWSLSLEALGWEGAMMVFGGMSLNILWAACLLKLPNDAKDNGSSKPKSKRPTFKAYTGFLTQLPFLLFLTCAVFQGLCMFIFGAYIPKYTTIVLPEVTSTETATLVCAMGAGSFVGRVLFGGLSMTSSKAPFILFVLGLALCGVDNALVPLCRTYIVLVLSSVCQGLMLGGWTTILTLVAVNLFGYDNLSMTVGLAFTFQGVGCLAGPPIASLLLDLTLRIDLLFYFAAACYMLSALAMLPLILVNSQPYKNITIRVAARRRRSKMGRTNPSFVGG